MKFWQTTLLSLFAVVVFAAGPAFAGTYAYFDAQQALFQCEAGQKAKRVLAALSSDEEKKKADDLYSQQIVDALVATAKVVFSENSFQAIFLSAPDKVPEMIAGTYRDAFVREKAADLTPLVVTRLNQNRAFLAAVLESAPYIDKDAFLRAVPLTAVEFQDLSGKKVGYVDLQKAVNTSLAGKEAKRIISGIVEIKQREVTAKENDLKALQKSLETTSAAERQWAEKRYQTDLAAYKAHLKSAQDSLQGVDAKFTEFIVEGLLTTLKGMFQENGQLSGIYENGGAEIIVGVKTVPVAKSQAIDLTDELIARYDRDPSHLAAIKALSQSTEAIAGTVALPDPQQNQPAPAAASLPPADTHSPVITISSPQVARGIKLTARESSLRVAGTVTDASGVALVMVNGQQAALDAQGNFSAEILLRVGENRITVTAIDIHRNTATQDFTLVREAAPAQGQRAASSGTYHALLIGNNDYRYLSRLQTAVNDARAVETVLRESYGFETKLLLNAGRKEVLSAINDFRKRLGENDHLLIYYAGHGEFDRSADKAYWLPVDAQKDDPADWIIADDITAAIRRLSSRHVLIVSDSCYSGTLTRSAQTHLLNRGERDEYLRKMTERPSRTLMASGGNEPVADGGGTGHSIFADSFLAALREIDRQEFTADELFFQHIKSRVAGRSEQVPEYNELRNSGHDGGDFVFVQRAVGRE